jgi:hypothetical protein
VSGVSQSLEPTAEYVDVGLSWCAGRDGVRIRCLRGDWERDFGGEQERLLRGVPPRRSASSAAAGSVLGMCVGSSFGVLSSWPGLNGGKGSKEVVGAGVPPSAEPLASTSLRLSGDGSTCRMVERVL